MPPISQADIRLAAPTRASRSAPRTARRRCAGGPGPRCAPVHGLDVLYPRRRGLGAHLTAGMSDRKGSCPADHRAPTRFCTARVEFPIADQGGAVVRRGPDRADRGGGTLHTCLGLLRQLARAASVRVSSTCTASISRGLETRGERARPLAARLLVAEDHYRRSASCAAAWEALALGGEPARVAHCRCSGLPHLGPPADLMELLAGISQADRGGPDGAELRELPVPHDQPDP